METTDHILNKRDETIKNAQMYTKITKTTKTNRYTNLMEIMLCSFLDSFTCTTLSYF